MDSLVIVSYGRCPGRSPLVGIGRVIERKERGGALWLLVSPVIGLPVEKWYSSADVKSAVIGIEKVA